MTKLAGWMAEETSGWQECNVLFKAIHWKLRSKPNWNTLAGNYFTSERGSASLIWKSNDFLHKSQKSGFITSAFITSMMYFCFHEVQCCSWKNWFAAKKENKLFKSCSSSISKAVLLKALEPAAVCRCSVKIGVLKNIANFTKKPISGGLRAFMTKFKW